MKIYAVLDEDRGCDTIVKMYNNKKDAIKHFNNAVNDIKNHLSDKLLKDENTFNMVNKYHLEYDIDDSWGNIKIYSQEFNLLNSQKMIFI